MSSPSSAAAESARTELVVTLDDPTQRSALRRWLDESEELHGRVEVAPPVVEPGGLGPELEIVRLLLESGGVATVLIESIVLWLRSRRSDVSVEVSIGRKKIKVRSGSLRNASTEDLAKLVRSVTRELTEK